MASTLTMEGRAVTTTYWMFRVGRVLTVLADVPAFPAAGPPALTEDVAVSVVDRVNRGLSGEELPETAASHAQHHDDVLRTGLLAFCGVRESTVAVRASGRVRRRRSDRSR